MVDSVNERPPRTPIPSVRDGTADGGDVEDPLDSRLVRATLEALSRVPAEALSLRKVARELDVSHQAPYVHFGSRRRFLAAVAGVGLQEAADDASTAVATAGRDPRLRLHALAGAYLDFVRTRPHVHDLAYGPTLAKSDHPQLQGAAIAYWSLLHDAVAACQPPGISEPEVLRRSTAAWGTVYGIARLSALHQIPDAVPADIDGLIHTALEVLIAGWQAQPHNDSDATTN